MSNGDDINCHNVIAPRRPGDIAEGYAEPNKARQEIGFGGI